MAATTARAPSFAAGSKKNQHFPKNVAIFCKMLGKNS
jgi:hypothetical protein